MKILNIEISDEPFNLISPKVFARSTGDFFIVVKMEGMKRSPDGKLVNPPALDLTEWCIKAFTEKDFVYWVAGYSWLFLRDEAALMRFKLRWC